MTANTDRVMLRKKTRIKNPAQKYPNGLSDAKNTDKLYIKEKNKMKKFLFQGDSITDAGRRRDKKGGESYGYPTFVAGILGEKYPQAFDFYNMGVSGDRSVDMLARVKRDVIAINPDVLTVLIGVNDVWHELQNDRNGIDADTYYTYYDMFLTQIEAMCPQTKIFILEPFILKACATEENWNVFRREVEMRAEKAKALAEKHSLTFIPLQEMFDKLTEKAPASHWLQDGVHPAPAGHYIIAETIIEAVEKHCPEMLK